MKSKTFTRITKVLLLAVLFMMVGVKGWGQTILNFPLTDNNLPESYSTGNESCSLETNASGGDLEFTNNGATITGWLDGALDKAWYTSTFNTSQYVLLKFSTFIASTNTGPKNFLLQYSLNNSTWTTISSITATNSLTNTGNIDLPSACSNQPNVYIRIIMADNESLEGGTVNEDGMLYLKGFVISGTSPAPPSSQASNISFVAITPTTITVGCSPGNGDRRIIVMNTTNSFSLPTDNYNPAASSTYGGSGEQVVYNGTGTAVNVIVPSSANTYWFRIFDYNYNDGMIRYITSTAVQNPKLCQLEVISLPTYANIRLTTATLGGTITGPASGTITERGIFWSTSSGVTTLSSKAVEGSVSTGLFAFNVSSLTRSRTIYFKAFVTNGSGTTLTSESSFDNIPEFSGEGNWEDETKWDVLQVPGLNFTYGSNLDRPIINGTCSLSTNTTVNTLTINASRNLSINPDYGLTLTGTLTNNGGTAGLILVSNATGTGSLMHNTANINATVQRYISGSSNLVTKKYHLVSVPINSSTYLSGVWLDSYLFTYLEASNTWYIWDDPTNNVLQTKMGAMVFYPNWDATTSKTYNITGQLNNGTYSPTVAYSGVGFGYNLVPNPYPSPIDWNAASGWTKSNISGTIWGFNSATGSYGSWNGSTGTNSVGRYIPVGQAFFVQATGSPTLTMTNSVRLLNTTDFLKSGELVPNILHLTASGNGGQDEIAVQFSYDATETSLDTYDAAKFYSDMAVPQLSTYTSVDNTALSITGLPNNENTSIVPLRFEMDYTGEITFQASAIESFNNSTIIKLEDKQLSQLIDLRKKPVYSFTHTPTDSPERFALHFGSVLGVEKPVAEKLSSITVSSGTIYLNYPASNSSIDATLFDVQGRLLKRVQLSNAGQDNFSISTDGIYILKLSLPSGTETHKIVVR